MNVMHLIFILILSLPTVALAEQQNPGHETPVKRGLKAGQLQAIQAIGQAVLAAKHSRQEDPDLKKLRQRVKELRQAAQELRRASLVVVKGTVKIIQQAEAGGIAPRAGKTQQMHAGRQQARGKLSASLAKMRTHRLAMKDQRASLTVNQDNSLISNAMAKCEELEHEVEEILLSQSNQQLGKLKGLLDHLEITRKYPAVSQQKPTPMISTITRHR